MNYCGDCPVCEEPVDFDDAGFCSECGMAFHWAECGSWYGSKHCCNNCAPQEEE